jgi:hypothetical protein
MMDPRIKLSYSVPSICDAVAIKMGVKDYVRQSCLGDIGVESAGHYEPQERTIMFNHVHLLTHYIPADSTPKYFELSDLICHELTHALLAKMGLQDDHGENFKTFFEETKKAHRAWIHQSLKSVYLSSSNNWTVYPGRPTGVWEVVLDTNSGAAVGAKIYVAPKQEIEVVREEDEDLPISGT